MCVMYVYRDCPMCSRYSLDSAPLKRCQDVCKGARFQVEGERCVDSGCQLFNRLGFDDEEEETYRKSTADRRERVDSRGRGGRYR